MHQHLWLREAIGPRYCDISNCSKTLCHMSAPLPPEPHHAYSNKQGHSSTHSPPTISGLPGHALTAKGDTYSRFHWLVLKLLLRLITHPHDHSLIVKDLFRLHNRPVTSGRLVFIAALSAQRTSLSLKASRLLKAQLQLWINYTRSRGQVT